MVKTMINEEKVKAHTIKEILENWKDGLTFKEWRHKKSKEYMESKEYLEMIKSKDDKPNTTHGI